MSVAYPILPLTVDMFIAETTLRPILPHVSAAPAFIADNRCILCEFSQISIEEEADRTQSDVGINVLDFVIITL